VIAVSLLVSWIVAVLFTPLLGVTLLPATMKKHHDKPGRFMAAFSRALIAAMRWRWVTIGVTVALFLAALAGMQFVQQQFFPSSDRPELVIDFTLPQNSSIAETKAQMDRFEAAALAGDQDIDHWSSYVGQGAVRFLLSFDVQPGNPFYGQIIVVTKDFAARERVKARLQKVAREQFVGTDILITPLALGPPSGRPVQYRVSGPEIQKVRELAQGLAAIVGENPHVNNPTYDWNEPARIVRVEVLQDKARQLGVSSEDIAATLNGLVGGSAITQVRDDIYLINVIGRAREAERGSIETFQNYQLPGKSGQSVPLAAVATLRYELEQPVIWRRSRVPTITVRATIRDATQPATVVQQLAPRVREFTQALPQGYKVEVAGPVEESAKAQGPIVAVVPIMLLIMATILMIQLESFHRLFLVVAVAPLGLIGVVAAMLPSRAPLGFVAILGVLALIGILIRNSVILIVQVEELRAEGRDPWQAVVEATEHRTRPILLTAAAASLALIPIAREVFWGPMAYAMMGGIIVGTMLTLLFLPALYVAWFRIKAPPASKPAEPPPAEPSPAEPPPREPAHVAG
jgi:multidrug efflux pump